MSRGSELNCFEVDYETYKKYLLKMKENKWTSPLGLHLGIIKALAQNDELLKISYNMMALALRHRILLPRWLRTQKLLLQKYKDPFIHRIRYITIVESDMQYVMKKWWAKDLQKVIDTKTLLNTKQYSRKKMTTIANIMSREITFSYHLLKGEDIVHIYYEAKNFFDRIIPEVAELAANSMGMNRVNTNFVVQVLKHFKHFLVIKEETSKKSYSDSPLMRIFGVGQRMGWSPTLWSIVNAVLMTIMEKQVPGEVYISPLSPLQVATSLEAYVDDVHGGVNMEGVRIYNKEHVTSLTLTQSIALHLHKYQRYLRCSGGTWLRASGYNLSFATKQRKLVYKS